MTTLLTIQLIAACVLVAMIFEVAAARETGEEGNEESPPPEPRDSDDGDSSVDARREVPGHGSKVSSGAVGRKPNRSGAP